MLETLEVLLKKWSIVKIDKPRFVYVSFKVATPYVICQLKCRCYMHLVHGVI